MDAPAGKAILLTGPGVAAIAVVRLAGGGVESFLTTHFSGCAAVGRAVHGTLVKDGQTLDDPVVVSIDQSTADVSLHGGTLVVEAFLELARTWGFAVVRNNDLAPDEALDEVGEIEREVQRWLPHARTELALRTLIAQPDAWQRGTPDSDDRALHWLLNPPRVAIVGAANVGKSTLANQLFGRECSIVADRPGTTRDWVGEIADIDGLAVMLVDTPGIRETSDEIEREAIKRSSAVIALADLVIVVLDASGARKHQTELLERYPDALVVLNKADHPRGRGMQDIAGIETVATTGEGIARLRTAVTSRFGCDAVDPLKARRWTDNVKTSA